MPKTNIEHIYKHKSILGKGKPKENDGASRVEFKFSNPNIIYLVIQISKKSNTQNTKTENLNNKDCCITAFVRKQSITK